jgi:hypothetical protein
VIDPPVPAPPGRAETRASSFGRTLRHAVRQDARLWPTLLVAVVVVGCVLRLLRWLDNPALWLDEAFLALNTAERPLSDLFGALEFLQSAPPGFIVLEKASEAVLGDAERSLRLVPLLASMASLPLFAYAARRILSAPAAVFSVTLLAVGPAVLERAVEAKPYPVDLFVTTLLLALYFWTTSAEDELGVGRIVVLGATCLAAVWLSFPAAFTVAGLICALAVRAIQVGSRRMLGLAAAIAGASLVSFAVVYAIASEGTRRVGAHLFDEGGHVGRLGVVRDAWNGFEYPGGFYYRTTALAALLVLTGVVALASRKNLQLLTLLGLPFALALAAALLHRYPLGGRFSFFLVPPLLLLVGRGTQALVEWSRKPHVIAVGVAVLVLSAPLALAAHDAVRPPARDDVKPALRHLVREWQPGDTLFVYANTQYVLRYYGLCRSCSPSGAEFPWPTRVAPPSPTGGQWVPALESVAPSLVIGSGSPGGSGGPMEDLERLPHSGRIWLLFTNVIEHDGLDDESLLVKELEQRGKLVEERRTRGARLYLFDM